MAKKRNAKLYDQNIVDALKKIPSLIIDKKHQFYIYFNNDQNRSNEKRFEHIASKRHELKVSDIELIEKGINNYFYFEKNKSLKGTYHYYIKRKGNNKGFIKVAIRLIKEKTKKYYVKTIFIVYQIKKL